MRYALLWFIHFNSCVVFLYMNMSYLGNLGFLFFFFSATNAAMNIFAHLSWGHV